MMRKGDSEINDLLESINVSRLEGEIWIYGAGNVARNEMPSIRMIDEMGGCQIRGFIDANPKLKGKTIGGYRIEAPEILYKLNPQAVILISSYRKKVRAEVGKLLDSYGIIWYTLDEVILGVFRNRVKSFYSFLEDKKSRLVYMNLIRLRLLGLSDDCCELDADYSDNMYLELPAFRRLNKNAIYVDVGSYTGYTVERFVCAMEGVFSRIIAFEPNPFSYERLKRRTDRLMDEDAGDIRIYPYAVGEKAGYMDMCTMEDYNAAGDISTRKAVEGEDTFRVKQISLDDFFCADKISQLKIDVMGYEKNVLLGAEKMIRNCEPNIVIATCYSLVDIWDITAKLHEMCSEYKFSLRSHRLNVTRFLYVYK